MISKKQRNSVFSAIVLFLGLACAITLSEVLLRAVGFRPWIYNPHDASEPTMHEPDSALGWQNKRGGYIVPPYYPAGQTIQITFLERGRRRTRVNSTTNSEGEVVIVGDSVTQAWLYRSTFNEKK